MLQPKSREQREREAREAQAYLDAHGMASDGATVYSDVKSLNGKRKREAKAAKNAIRRRVILSDRPANSAKPKPPPFSFRDESAIPTGSTGSLTRGETPEQKAKRLARDAELKAAYAVEPAGKPVHSKADMRRLGRSEDYAITRHETDLEKSARLRKEAIRKAGESEAMSYSAVGTRKATDAPLKGILRSDWATPGM